MMDFLGSESIFILVGSLVGFGSILTTIISCLFTNTGSVALKYTMIPFLLCFLYNCTALAFYISHMFISYLPETNKVLAYVHNGVKLILSIVITVAAAKLWEAFRNAAHCIRFSDCGEDEMILVHGLNNLTDLFCGQTTCDYSNDSCRRWLAQIPLIALTIASMIVIHSVSQLWDDKFAPDIHPTLKEPSPSRLSTKSSVIDNGQQRGQQKDDDVHCSKCYKCLECCTCASDCRPCTSRRTSNPKSKSKSRNQTKTKYNHHWKQKAVSLEAVLQDCIRCD